MASPQTLQERALDQACQAMLFVALELSDKKWKLALSDGNKRRIVTIAAGDLVTPTGKPPPLAVRLEKALPFQR